MLFPHTKQTVSLLTNKAGEPLYPWAHLVRKITKRRLHYKFMKQNQWNSEVLYCRLYMHVLQASQSMGTLYKYRYYMYMYLQNSKNLSWKSNWLLSCLIGKALESSTKWNTKIRFKKMKKSFFYTQHCKYLYGQTTVS